MMLAKMKMMANIPLTRIRGITKDGAASFRRKKANNPSSATLELIHPKVLMTSPWY
jgi:hypothetical protein